MSKFDAISDHLRSQDGPVSLLMSAISDLVPGGLPRSAFAYQAWWNNDDDSHVQSRSWGSAGYAARPDLRTKTVLFVPRG